MTSHDSDNIGKRLEETESKLPKKADVSYAQQIKSEIDGRWAEKETEDKEWKFDFNKVLEIAVISKAVGFIKLEASPCSTPLP